VNWINIPLEIDLFQKNKKERKNQSKISMTHFFLRKKKHGGIKKRVEKKHMEGVETEKPFKKPPFERRASITSPHRIPVSFGENKKTVFTSGRPPWYSKEGQVVEPFMIGCAGGTASGKTTVAKFEFLFI